MLENNSKDLKTVVETFIIEETAPLIYDNEQLTRWNTLVLQLGLEGQSKIVSPGKSPIPFMHLKTATVNVFQTLCPRAVDVQEFNISPIPVEILDLIALSVKEKFFQRIQIWYDDKTPDPVCIGVTGYFYRPTWSGTDRSLDNVRFDSYESILKAGVRKEDIYFMNEAYYLIGKWGDARRPLEELKQMATERYVAQRRNDILNYIKKYQRELDEIESDAFNRFN